MIHVFIINSITADPGFGYRLREHLKKRSDIRSFVFNTTHVGMEAALVDKMIHFFEDEKIRFYACGGSGTIRNIMQGTVQHSNVEFAFYPLGKTNDFLKIFDEDAAAFSDIDRLIDGHVEYIDYIRTNYGYALNTVSFGMDSMLSRTLEDVREFDIFGGKIPFIIAYLRSLIHIKPQRIIYEVDGMETEAAISELIVGNGKVLGGRMQFTDKPDVLDGKLDYVAATDKHGVGILKIISQMVNGNIEELRKMTTAGKCSSFVIRSLDGSDMALNLDGEITNGGSEWKIEVIEKGFAFVVPDGVSMRV